MIVKIYDFSNKAKEIHLNCKPSDIREIMVDVITGDEIVTFFLKNGKIETYDASDNRETDVPDGSYIVRADEVEEWLAFEPVECCELSYQRMSYFEEEDEEIYG